MSSHNPQLSSTLDRSKKVYQKTAAALSKDMPLILQSCDAVAVDPAAIQLLSELTTNYLSNLVDAAVDAQDVLNDGVRQPLPPPPPPQSRNRRVPLPAPYVYPPQSSRKPTGGSSSQSKSSSAGGGGAFADSDAKKGGKKSRRRMVEDEFWDDPLPEPVIKKRTAAAAGAATTAASASDTTQNNSNNDDDDDDDDTNHRRGSGRRRLTGYLPDDWVGVAGVDLFEESRARKAHVAAPSAISASNFLFPVCHDPTLYGRCRSLQIARRNMEPLLGDAALHEVVRQEAAVLGKQSRMSRKQQRAAAAAGAEARRRRQRRSKNGNDREDVDGYDDDDDDDDDEPEATDSEDEDHGAAWPGLDSLLPTHTLKDFAA